MSCLCVSLEFFSEPLPPVALVGIASGVLCRAPYLTLTQASRLFARSAACVLCSFLVGPNVEEIGVVSPGVGGGMQLL